ncbi:ATP synthase subunit I [Virgibacillus oceani]|uniref:ATP synthase protein I n=1 Tax=Virgibacillus oceani TaxID=1479511 RepID=A0A917HQQ5_9BACI|nr:ATP synthase subunit I [Virgibacillus oceani]GGG86254.1 ATP synthase protein I [Virgibacillus oceani]
MSQYQNMIARERKWMFYLLAILVLGAGFTPYLRIFLGLLLGSVVSFYNLYLLQKKTNDVAEAVGQGKSVRGVGTLSRLAAVALAVVIALRYEDYFHIIAVVIGLMTSYLVIMIDFFVHESKK